MSGPANRFEPRSGDVATLVAENPLAWIFLRDADGPFATAAPVRPVVADGRLTKLVGHVPRHARIAARLESPCEALFLILGPHGYVSPSWLSDRTQAPTWNFTSAQFIAEARLCDDPAFLDAHLRDLTATLEQGRDRAWHVDEMGARLHKLAAHIVAFEALILSENCRFKLGQDENDRTYQEIVRGLGEEGDSHLLDWMRMYNPSRN
jgi:predicted FMN-binding regulatory protein PaiB